MDSFFFFIYFWITSLALPIELTQKDSNGQDDQKVGEDGYKTKAEYVRCDPHQIQGYRVKAAR